MSEIITRRLDYFKTVSYRNRKTITRGDEVNCPVVAYLIDKYKLNLPLADTIINKDGIGVDSRRRQTCLTDFRGSFFINNKYEEINSFLKWHLENDIRVCETRIDICVDFISNDLTPFKRNSQNYFGKLTKKMTLIPEIYRGKIPTLSQWTQRCSSYSVIFYDKTFQIQQEAPKLLELYPEVYTTQKVKRMELKIFKPDIYNFKDRNEDDLVREILDDFYKKHKFSKRNSEIKKLFIY